jgi:hypothetical protein
MGEARGKVLGEAKGEAKGKASIIKDQLRHRFGSLPPNIVRRISRASESRLDTFGRRLLDAKTIDEVLAR